ncbi:MAG: DUF2344 domain-containing protein, partial [Desulfobulbaceae bacterium]|nr:DUF2344 domain-containing protein [Desulfobulbaceae bacterium]
ELSNAKGEVYTPDCRYHACQKCGLCDFETLFPIVYNRTDKTVASEQPSIPKKENITATKKSPVDTGHFKYIVHYSRTGDICFLGHLEILQIVFRTLRRASVATNYSQGFNPSPKISFGPALPVGTESLAEFFIMDLPAPLGNPAAITEQLNAKIPPGLKITKIELHSGKVPQKICIAYNLTLPGAITDSEKIRAENFINSSNFLIKKTRKGKTKEIDIRPLIINFSMTNPDLVQLEMVSASAQPGIKPLEALTEIFGLEKERSLQTKILKTSWHALDET